jgi:hypothetical protein
MAMAGPPQVTTLLDSLDRSVDLLLFYNKYDRRQQNATPSIFNLRTHAERAMQSTFVAYF